jgi:hypothetical protein
MGRGETLSLTLTKEQGLRPMFGSMREEIAGENCIKGSFIICTP